MPKVMALTGNIACGKSEIGEILRRLGVPVLDSDQVVHDLYEKDEVVRAQIEEKFGTLDRQLIGQKVFGDSDEAVTLRKALEAIIHPAVDREFRTWVDANQEHKLLVNLIPLVFEAKLEHRYDLIATVSSDSEQQLARMQLRNPDLNEEEILKRINSQMPQEMKADKSDYVLENNGSLEELETMVKDLLAKI